MDTLVAPTASTEVDISLAAIERAADGIDPVFTRTPQFVDEPLCAALGRHVLVKVETANPLRCFKGRGADFFMRQRNTRQHLVCVSTGNFGQAIASAGRTRGIGVHVFLPIGANPVKEHRIKALGARVTVTGRDSAACAEAARRRRSVRTASGYWPAMWRRSVTRSSARPARRGCCQTSISW